MNKLLRVWKSDFADHWKGGESILVRFDLTTKDPMGEEKGLATLRVTTRGSETVMVLKKLAKRDAIVAWLQDLAKQAAAAAEAVKEVKVEEGG